MGGGGGWGNIKRKNVGIKHVTVVKDTNGRENIPFQNE